MAMLSMLFAISRDGFWAPVRGITSVVFGDQHFGGDFSFWPVAVGAAGHMMNSVALGALFGIAARALLAHAGRGALVAAGAVYGLLTWAVLLLLIGGALQPSDLLADAVPQWTWIVGHLMFGALTGYVVAVGGNRAD